MGERWSNLLDRLRSSPASLPSAITLSANGGGGDGQTESFVANAHYFQVVVNEMFLQKERGWFSLYDPTVFVLTEFGYGGRIEAVPFVVGPALLERHGQKAPLGMLYRNTRVAGIHPYRGGRFSITVVLCRVERKNYATDLLRLVEHTANALNVGAALSTYLQIADVVVEGIDELLGRSETTPIAGLRSEFGGAGSNSPLVPATFALVDVPDIDPSLLGTDGGRLVDAVSGKPYRAADYVMFSIEQLKERDDENMLSFYPTWERIVRETSVPSDDAWESAKHNWVALSQSVLVSPDLTEPDADSFLARYEKKMIAHRRRAKRITKLGAPKKRDRLEQVRKRTLAEIAEN
jgi:hypothetical protein